MFFWYVSRNRSYMLCHYQVSGAHSIYFLGLN